MGWLNTQQLFSPLEVPLARILLVDDSEDLAPLHAELERVGYQVHAVRGGGAALQYLRSEPVNLVLLDAVMSGISGLDVLRAIRERYKKLELPVIMTTRSQSSSEMVEALKLGANDFMQKPLDLPVVIARIEGALNVSGSFQKAVQSAPSPAPVTPSSVASPDLDAPPRSVRHARIGPGTVLSGRYELGNPLAEGGFAVVYGAVQRSTGQRVAVKILHRNLERTSRARFQRETDIIASLNHPHIVRLVDSGEVSGCLERPGAERPEERSDMPFLVMEYLDGSSLEQLLLHTGKLEAAESVDLVIPIISAVANAHRNGVIHRDIKPGNIFVDEPEGAPRRPVILDFGIAKPDEDRDFGKLTETANMVGTPHYMAPEQAMADTLDARADQYSLGVVLYEMLTGKTPYHGARGMAQVVSRLVTGTFPRPKELAPDLHPWLEKLILRAMSLNPEDRFEEISELGEALLPFGSEGLEEHHRRLLTTRWTSAPTVRMSGSYAPSTTRDEPATVPDASRR